MDTETEFELERRNCACLTQINVLSLAHHRAARFRSPEFIKESSVDFIMKTQIQVNKPSEMRMRAEIPLSASLIPSHFISALADRPMTGG